MAGKIKIGKKAPDFKLKDHLGNDFNLADCKGKKVLLSFHPLAWTNVCAKQMQSLEKNLAIFKKLNTIAVGISVDTEPSKKEWAKFLKIKQTKLLCDFWLHGAVAKQFSIFRQNDGFSERVNIIIDEYGKIIFFNIYPITELPDIKEIITFLKTNKILY